MHEDINARAVAARFGAAAKSYDALSDIQRAVARKLMKMAGDSMDGAPPARILEIGCGTGTLTELLVRRFPGAEIHAVDIARPMIDVARKRLSGRCRIRWHEADARSFRPGGTFPLIVSSSALHWMAPVGDTIKRMESILAPGGLMAAALMVRGTFEELHEARMLAAPGKVRPISLPAAGGVLDAFAGAGMRASASEESLRARYDSARSFLRSLNRQGVTGAADPGAAPLNRSELRALTGCYDSRCSLASGGVYASYRVLYALARKPG
jgi:malonyl-CoA O-methyltransferase